MIQRIFVLGKPSCSSAVALLANNFSLNDFPLNGGNRRRKKTSTRTLLLNCRRFGFYDLMNPRSTLQRRFSEQLSVSGTYRGDFIAENQAGVLMLIRVTALARCVVNAQTREQSAF